MPTGSPHHWTPAEDLFLKRYYAYHGTTYCASALTLSYHVVRARARELGLYSNAGRRRHDTSNEPRLRGWGWT